MEIKNIKVGDLRTNCYILSEKDEALVIDPGFEAGRIKAEMGNLKVKAIVLTHGHYDHVTEVFKLKALVDAPVMIGEKDEAMMAYSTGNARADRLLKDGDKLKLGDLEFIIIATPGHSQGGLCLYNEKEKVLFSGDTLFAGDYGRVDLPGSSPPMMKDSLAKLLKLPPDTRVYPGHGRASTIRDEQNLLE